MYRKNKNSSSLLRKLKATYPDPQCALDHESPFQLLAATILSAQCTDERVNKVTPALFREYPDAKSMSKASPTRLEELIRSTGFYRNKAKSLLGMSKMVTEKYDGQIPRAMEQLLELPGVARKTANVLLGTAFKMNEGVVVDTHVMRLSERFGLSNKKTPEKIEKDLMEIVPRNEWTWFSHAAITHGRRVCKARNPDCAHCPIRKDCANPEL